MCGIAGILTAAEPAERLTPALSRMGAALAHRGPDDSGIWQAPSGQALLAHTRLAIIDLSAAGHQPMTTANGRYAITYNGEIYNFRELRASLEQRGVTFRTATDTEVVLKAYELDGPACIERLRGMFALVIWDEQERTALLARDRFGIKPLYFHSGKDGRLLFASGVRALLRSGLVPAEIDLPALKGYYRWGSVQEPQTLIRNVRSLEAGQIGIWRAGTLTTRSFWQPSFDGRKPSSDPVGDTRRALLDSVEHHFVSDTEVGVFLSGGMDSTALVALAATVGRTNIRTFSLTFPGWSEDEGEAAARTAAAFGTRHTALAVEAESVKALLPQFLAAADQPSIDGLNTFVVSKLAHDHGLKVVLSGVGADELFGGYPSFDGVPSLARINRRLSSAGPLRNGLGWLLESLAPNPKLRRLGELLRRPPCLENAYVTFRSTFTDAEAQRLAYGDVPGVPAANKAHDCASHDPDERDTVSRLELTRYMRNQLLRDTDSMSMAWGLELRVPFLDGPLFDTLSSIPAAARLEPQKRLLLRAVPEIPSWVANAPKGTFRFPYDHWLQDAWQPVFQDVVRSRPVPLQTWYQQMSRFVVEQWISSVRSEASTTWPAG